MRGGTNVSARPEMNRVGTVTARTFRIDKYCNKKYENIRIWEYIAQEICDHKRYLLLLKIIYEKNVNKLLLYYNSNKIKE